jgi:predicted O-linked N-acetylglucosamine transferase (SPINDLY family)
VQANFGHALRAVGRLDEAAGALERAIRLKPDYFIAYNNLGMVRRAQGRLADAVACYRRALAIAPRLIAAQVNLGNALREMGALAESAEVYRRLVQVAPSNADAHAGLGVVLEAQGDTMGAMSVYESALRADPNNSIALVNLGMLLKRLTRADEALALLRRAEAAKPVSAEVKEKLARVLWDAGLYEEALSRFEEAIKLKPAPATRVVAATLVPPVYRSLDEVTRWRQRLVDEVGKLTREGVKMDLTRQTARSPFYVPYAGLEDREILRAIAALHEAPSDAAPLSSRSRQAADGRVRVGFCSTFFKDHTVGLWTQGLVAQLPRDRVEVVVLSHGLHNDAIARRFREKADTFIELPASLPKAREAMASAQLDVLVYADIGMEGYTYSLAFSRLAPVQCAMWGHPSTSGIATVDYFISSELAEAEGAEANYTEKLVRLKALPLYYYRPAPPPKLSRIDLGLPDSGHLYGCLQATFKLHPAFDFVIGEILRRDPTGWMLIPRTGSSNWDKMVMDRLASSYADVAERIRFFDRLPRESFAALNALCEVTLAPFPFGAGDTSLVSLAIGVPVVTMMTSHLRGNFTAAMYRAMGVEDCIAATREEYVELATRLANDPAAREGVSRKLLDANSALFESMAGVNELADFLTRVGREGQVAASPGSSAR